MTYTEIYLLVVFVMFIHALDTSWALYTVNKTSDVLTFKPGSLKYIDLLVGNILVALFWPITITYMFIVNVNHLFLHMTKDKKNGG